jgi:hypothetical protein
VKNEDAEMGSLKTGGLCFYLELLDELPAVLARVICPGDGYRITETEEHRQRGFGLVSRQDLEVPLAPVVE